MTEPKAPTISQTEAYFYSLLSGHSRYALFTSLVDMYLPALIGPGQKTAAEIIDILKLSPHRGRKWLHALHLAGLLDQVEAEPGSEADDTLPRSDPEGSSWARDPDVRYRLAPVLRSMFGADGYSGYFFREFLRYFRVADAYYLPNILRGEVIENPVRYPPVDWADTLLLHDWMRSRPRDARDHPPLRRLQPLRAPARRGRGRWHDGAAPVQRLPEPEHHRL